MPNHEKHEKKDTHGMHVGHAGHLDLEARIQETYAKVIAIQDQRERVKVAVTALLDDAAAFVQKGDLSGAAVAIAAMRTNLDPAWLDMALDAK